MTSLDSRTPLLRRLGGVAACAAGWVLAGSPGLQGMVFVHSDTAPATHVAQFAPEPAAGWIRLRGPAELSATDPVSVWRESPEIIKERAALSQLREAGRKTCLLIRWQEPPAGAVAARTGRRYLSDNLAAVFARSHRLGQVYGDLVDAWEIDNEPDLGFVPEAAEDYAAHLKAVYLGIKAGSREHAAGGGLVIMAPLGLPPGPWLERFADNDGLAYTDGYNYHYYGYASDFTGVYRQHEAAVKELTVEAGSPLLSGVRSSAKYLPVFVSEIGYGMLHAEAARTKEGRLRQWRWFREVGRQVVNLGIEAPMAFLLQPHLERKVAEFGLTTMPVTSAGGGASGTGLLAGGLQYAPGDFGSVAAEPWMKLIGIKLGQGEATPALAQWVTQLGQATAARLDSSPWAVANREPSPVVIDFLPGRGLQPVKRYGGSFVMARTPGHEAGVKLPVPVKPPVSAAGEGPETQQPPRRESYTIHVRTQNGNLYEVYPTRSAGPDWEPFLEQYNNFTLSFYGRGKLPWRFRDNPPRSLVIELRPEELPVTYEFRNLWLVQLATRTADGIRHGQGQVTLYNFLDRPVRGRLNLSPGLRMAADPVITLAAGEARALDVSIQLPVGDFVRTKAAITFQPDDPAIPLARWTTQFLPPLDSMSSTLIAELLPPERPASGSDRTGVRILAGRRSETEALTSGHAGEIVEEGVAVMRIPGGLGVTITSKPAHDIGVFLVEIPWPSKTEFPVEAFLAAEARLK